MKLITRDELQAQVFVATAADYSGHTLNRDGNKIEVSASELDMLIDALAFNGADVELVETLGEALDHYNRYNSFQIF
ncbi:hypothetical protein SmaMPs15_000061 [Stenotrophomonas maltophilia phage vB_SmaM_Ps15]|uniref:Uncharacterized protein n=1 Tax=Stenotrophomonas maltophilia phage vB_SmaM_Ps15 TaxID=3071007 RepID=A0AAE9FL62_9CAUD|nr:hypothetical protein PQC01_gp061 [Stenotrophomonas maltophilia phage vB_SmaM_Ps15]UMO77212.1 hypothetical protein SmaMPs15_000061 [Stenotrophomonas maltophilia phage vB_SmaM_Ps15]